MNGAAAIVGLKSDSKTNMVPVEIPQEKLAGLVAHLKAQQILVLARTPMRRVTHLDVEAGGIERALAAFRTYSSNGSNYIAAAISEHR